MTDNNPLGAPFPIGSAVALIIILSLGLWAGIWLGVSAFAFLIPPS